MKNIILLILSTAILSSCFSFKMNFALTKLGIYDDQVKISTYTNKQSKVLLIPMHHVGTQKFYDDVKNKIDSLNKIDYSFYYEGIKIDSMNSDSIKVDKDIRKLRKITGVIPSAENYLNKFKVLAEQKNYTFKKELVGQPSNKKLGLVSSDINSKNVDIKLSELIKSYEEKNGEVKLEECDFNTGLKKEYKCKSIEFDSESLDDVFISKRNKLIIDQLEKDKSQKIAIIYGKNHFQEIIEFLSDEEYQKIKPDAES